MPDLYRTLAPKEANEAQRRMVAWTSMWCCSVPPGPKKPGHIWYDFFWDVLPHENRHRVMVTEPWTPTFGP